MIARGRLIVAPTNSIERFAHFATRPRSYNLGELKLWEKFGESDANKPGNQLRIDVIVSTGETFTPYTIALQ